jgi:RNA polymerase sigma factor (sigma-70 family)
MPHPDPQRLVFDLPAILAKHRKYLTTVIVRAYGPLANDVNRVSDLVQQTYVEALKNATKFEFKSEVEFRSWLRTLLNRQVQRVSNKEAAQNRSEVEYSRQHYCDVFETPLDELLIAERRKRFDELLLKLSQEDRQSLQSRLQGTSLEDWAADIGISVVAAKKRRTRALRRVKDLWTAMMAIE